MSTTLTTPETRLKKPNSSLVMTPKIGKLTAASRKLFNSLLYSAQKQLVASKNSGTPLGLENFFSAYLQDILKPIGNPKSHSLTMMQDHIREMQSVRVEWTSPDTTSGVVWDSLVLISQAKLMVENGRVRVLWAFPPDIVASLTDPENDYTVIRLEELGKLSGYAAVALYEICTRFGENPRHKTARKPKEWWVSALSGDSHKKSLKDKDDYIPREWRMFKLEKVRPAIEEINKKTNLFIELIEYNRSGNVCEPRQPVTDVQFMVRRNSVKLDHLSGKPQPKVTECHVQAVSCGVSSQEITTQLDAGYSEIQIMWVLEKLKIRNAQQPPVNNIPAYFKSILATLIPETSPAESHVSGDAGESDFQKAEKVLSTLPAEKKIPDFVQKTPAQYDDLKTKLRGLNKADFDSIVQQGVEILTGKGLYTAHLRRRLGSGSADDALSSPIFLEAISSVFAEGQQQSDPLVEPSP